MNKKQDNSIQSTINKNMVYYIASPFSHEDKEIERVRYEIQSILHSELIKEGYITIAPIEMCYHLHKNYGLPSGYEFWKKRDRALINCCDGVIVLKMGGYKTSKGVQDEIAYAKSLGKEIYYLDTFTREISNE